MKTLTDFFVSPKYRKLHDVIFRIFVISVIGTGLLWFFFDWLVLPQIVAILFVVYEIPNMFFHWVAFYREK